jgi:tetratricopeptide (TPR) repeat protein
MLGGALLVGVAHDRKRAGAAMPASSPVEHLVRRLVATEDAARRAALFDRFATVEPVKLKAAAARLLAEALPLFGADPLRMERLCTAAGELAARAGDAYLVAMARMQLGDALRAQRRDTEACACYDDAQAAFTRLGRPVEAARTRIGWIDSMSKLGRPREALAAARKARRVFVDVGDTVRLASIEGSIGNIHLDHGRFPAAFRHFTKTLALCRSLGDGGRPGVARAHQSRGLVLGRLGRHHEAIADLEAARTIFERLGDTAGTARVTRSIGLAQMALGRYGAALRSFESARSLFRSLGLRAWLVGLSLEAADCYLALNRPEEALAALDEAEQEAGTVKNPQDALGLAVRRAAACLALDRHAEARTALDEVAQRASVGGVQHRAWHAVQQAALLLRDGDPAAALAGARAAERLARAAGMRRLVADAAVVQGRALLALGRTDEAEQAGARAARLARAADAAALLQRAYELLGRVAEAQGRPAMAGRRYAAAIAALEREQQGVIFEFRDSFVADRGAAYERLAVLQLRAGRPAAAFATAERAKSRALLDAIVGVVEPRPRPGRRGVAARTARALRAARAEYAAAVAGAGDPKTTADGEQARRLAALEARIARLVREAQVAAAADHLGPLDAPAPATVLPPLKEGTALLEFFTGGDDILRFVVEGDTVRGELLAGAVPEVERLLRLFRVNLDAAERAAPDRLDGLTAQAHALLGRLYERLLGRLDGLDRWRSLVVVPHGLLHYLPFHALHDGARYLVEWLPVSYAPSAAVYAVCGARRHRRGRGGALVLAHSAGGRLPFTLHEAAAVAGVLGCPARLEEAATRGLLEREGRGATVIHIAAHGRFRADAPLFSCVELADGPLTTADVYDLELRAAQVTLSACETGRAVLGGGDELAGLARAFLFAGADGLLVSQWRVDDARTAALMTRFYRELANGTGRAEALRRAQLACIAGEPGGGRVHPLLWAGFQIIGDGQG